MKKTSSMISRRDFLKGAAAGAVSLAGMGLLGACSASSSADSAETGTTTTAESTTTEATTAAATTEATVEAETTEAAESSIVTEQTNWRTAPAPIDDNQINESYETDVVVVGHGYAGLNACRYLASQGIKVILIESQSEDRYMAMGNEAGTPNAKALLDRGVPAVDPIEYYNNWMLNCNYQANPQLVMKFCQNSGASMDEYLSVLSEEDLAQMTTAFYPPTEHQMDHIGAYKFWPSTCSFYSQECNQTYIHKKNREKAISDGATFLFSMEAQQLISDDKC